MKNWLSKYWSYPAVAIVVATLCAVLGEPYSRQDSHEMRGWLSALAAGLVLLRLGSKHLKVKPLVSLIVTRFYLSVLVAAGVFAVFNYYQFDKRWAEGLDDYTDISYYYLNTKYLDELGYFRFYAAVLTADKEYKDRHATKMRSYRDLRDYEVKSTRVAFEHGEEIRRKYFTKERWKQFQHDVDWFMARKRTGSLQRHYFVDHGYNPPPTWAVPGLILSAITPVENIKHIALVDVAFIVAMLAFVAWAFGLEVMLYVGLFFLTTFSGRWPVLGHSLLRFDWSACLVISICLMKKERYASSGAVLAYAALNRIFPAIFFFPWVVTVAWRWFKERKIPAGQIRFTVGAAVVTVLLVVAALGLFGTERFEESGTNLLMHNASYSSHRVGLGDIMVYGGETTREEIAEVGGLYKKELAVQGMKHQLWAVALVVMVFIGIYIARTRHRLWEYIHLGALPMFCVTNPQINYYNLRLVLIVWHMGLFSKRPIYNTVGMLLLLGTEIVSHYSQVQGNPRYTTTTYTSIGLGAYYVIMMGLMVWEIFRSFREQGDAASSPETSSTEDGPTERPAEVAG